MPNSDFNLTRSELIAAILRRVGNHDPSTDEENQCILALNMLVKRWDAEGRLLWGIDNTESTLTTVTSQREYVTGVGASNINANILQLEKLWLLKGTNYVPVTIIGKDRAMSTYEREGSGEPYMAYLERLPKQADNILHLFPSPNAAYAVRYTFRRRLYDFDNASDNPDFPGEWFDALRDNGAKSIAPEYNMPAQDYLILKQDAKESQAAAMVGQQENYDDDRPQPDYY